MRFMGLLAVLGVALSAHAGKDRILLKNFRELYASYETVMGVDGRDAELQELLKLNIDRLPKYGVVEEMNSPVVLAATEISGAFCKKAITREKAVSHCERILFADADFTRGPKQFSSVIKVAMIENLANLFWQRNSTEAETQVLSEIITKASVGSDETPADTERVLQVLCSSFATSLNFLVK